MQYTYTYVYIYICLIDSIVIIIVSSSSSSSSGSGSGSGTKVSRGVRRIPRQGGSQYIRLIVNILYYMLLYCPNHSHNNVY